MALSDEKSRARAALLRWGLVLALHAALFWMATGLLTPTAPLVGPQKLTRVRLIGAAPPQPPRSSALPVARARPDSSQPATPIPIPAAVEALTNSDSVAAAVAIESASGPASAAATALALDGTTIAHAIRSSQSGLARAQARGMGKEDLLRSPTPDQMAEAIKKTERRDCRNAYGAAGLLALIPLAISTVTDTGCKW